MNATATTTTTAGGPRSPVGTDVASAPGGPTFGDSWPSRTNAVHAKPSRRPESVFR